MTIAFIGGGIMGEAMLKSILKENIASPGEIIVSDVNPNRRSTLESLYNVRTSAHNLEAAEQGDIIVLAVKPQAMPGVMAELKGKIPSNNPVISIVAGVNTAVLRTGLDHTLIVRAMPNTPAQIGAGMTVWTATHEVSAIQKGTAEAIFSSLGKELYVNDEKFLDMATAISGSGPAYIFLVIEALIDAAVHMGFTRDTATDMVSQTVLGSAMLMSKTGKHPAELRNMVTSPGGTTAEALLKLEAGGLRGLIMQAVVAAYDKSKKLGDVSHK